VSFKKAAMNPIMLATDGSPEAQKATATAIELAKEFGTELVVVAVWELHAAGYGPMGFAPTPIGGELAWLGEDEAQRIAAEAAARAEEAGVETRIRVLRGFPVDVICETAETFAPRILVLGSHGRGAFKRALLGSVSTGVLHHATCPVLVVRGDSKDRHVGKESREAVPA
jgi:nucleotide-binding universal stress UspA family protein